MTIELTVLIKSSSCEQIIELVERFLGHNIEKCVEDSRVVYSSKAMFIEWLIDTKHTLEDDNGIEFEKYDCLIYLVPLRAGSDLSAYDQMYEKTALFIAYIVSHELQCNTLVVRRLQHKLMAYNNGISESFKLPF